MLQKSSIKEIGYMLAGLLFFSAIMVGCFALTGHFSITVVWGALLGSFLALLNFVLLAFTVEKAFSKGEKHARLSMSLSYTLRMLILAAGIILAFKHPEQFHYLAVVIPFLFPRIIIFLRQFMIKKSSKKGVEQ